MRRTPQYVHSTMGIPLTVAQSLYSVEVQTQGSDVIANDVPFRLGVYHKFVQFILIIQRFALPDRIKSNVGLISCKEVRMINAIFNFSRIAA